MHFLNCQPITRSAIVRRMLVTIASIFVVSLAIMQLVSVYYGEGLDLNGIVPGLMYGTCFAAPFIYLLAKFTGNRKGQNDPNVSQAYCHSLNFGIIVTALYSAMVNAINLKGSIESGMIAGILALLFPFIGAQLMKRFL